MNPQHLAVDLRNAYEAHDRHAFEQGLQRMVAAFGGATLPTGQAPACGRRSAPCECQDAAAAAVCMFRTPERS